jgi:hypothetical protein
MALAGLGAAAAPASAVNPMNPAVMPGAAASDPFAQYLTSPAQAQNPAAGAADQSSLISSLQDNLSLITRQLNLLSQAAPPGAANPNLPLPLALALTASAGTPNTPTAAAAAASPASAAASSGAAAASAAPKPVPSDPRLKARAAAAASGGSSDREALDKISTFVKESLLTQSVRIKPDGLDKEVSSLMCALTHDVLTIGVACRYSSPLQNAPVTWSIGIGRSARPKPQTKAIPYTFPSL